MAKIAEYSAAMRFSSAILERIGVHALLTKESRNQWLINAAHRLLERGEPLRSRLTARDLLSDRQHIIMRADPLTLELIDEACEEVGVTRTVWMLDAVISRLEEQPLRYLRNNVKQKEQRRRKRQ